MTQEEKQLILKDLCARLPYGVICKMWGSKEENALEAKFTASDYASLESDSPYSLEYCKPYLRPMSSMTEEEFLTLYDMCRDKVLQFRYHPTYYTDFKTKKYIPEFIYDSNQLDYLILHHFDYRGLIEKGLALEAPKEMYETNEINPQ